MPALRFTVYILHWVPAMFLALANVIRDVPVVWAKTEHVGAGLVSTTMPPTLTVSETYGTSHGPAAGLPTALSPSTF
jgi:hypothetical protein